MNPPPLRVFLDRSIGTKKIAKALRDLGVNVQTIHDRYGDESSTVPDVRWIADAARDGLAERAERAEVSVDADNLAAVQLFRSVGFLQNHRTAYFELDA